MTAAVDKFEATVGGAVIKEKDLEKAALRVSAAAIPQERYNQKMRELAELVGRGKISLEQASQIAIKYQRELDKAGEAGRSAFGSQMASDLAGMVLGMGSVTAVVGAITGAFRDAEQAAQAAADAVLESLGAVGELQQLGKEGFAKGLAITRDLVSSGVVKPGNRSQAAEIASNIINAGLTDDQTNFVVNDLGKSNLVKPENLVAVSGNLKGLMTAFGETDIRDLGRRTLVAANKTKADLAITSREVMKFAALSSASGIGLDESLSAFVISQESAASPEAAAEMQKSFFSQVLRRQLGKGNLVDTLANITKQIPKGGTAFDVLGDANAVIGYQDLIRQQGRLQKETADIRGAPKDIFQTAGGLLDTDPVYRASRILSHAQGKETAASEKMTSVKETLFSAMQSELNAQGTLNNESAITRYQRNAIMGITDVAGTEANAFREELARSAVLGNRLSEELLQDMRDYLRDLSVDAKSTNSDQKSRAAARPE